MITKLSNKIQSDIREFLDDMDFKDIVNSAILEEVEIRDPSDQRFVDKIVDAIADKVVESLDAETIADHISDELKKHILQYNPTIGVDGNLACNSCYREHGNWKTSQGGQLEHANLCKNGVAIIVLDDLN